MWVISGYTCNFNIYTCKGSTPSSEQSLSFDVVMKLVAPFEFQGYELFTDNFYSSPSLFDALLEVGIHVTGTLCTNHTGVPESVVQVKQELMKTKTACGTGYYVHESSTTYVWYPPFLLAQNLSSKWIVSTVNKCPKSKKSVIRG